MHLSTRRKVPQSSLISTGSLSMLWMVTAFALTFGGLLLVR